MSVLTSVLQSLEQIKSEQSKRNRFGDVREESLVQESETREAGLLSKIADLESDLKNANKGERRAVNEVDRLSAQNSGLLKEVEKQHEELKKVKLILLLPPPGGYVIILVCMCVCVCVYVFVCEHDNSRNNKHFDAKFCTYICHWGVLDLLLADVTAGSLAEVCILECPLIFFICLL